MIKILIKIHNVVQKALCDACGAKLSHEDQTNADGTPSATHHGLLQNRFGYGSPLDGIDNALAKLDLCEACYIKAFDALKLPISQYSTPWHLRVRTEAFEIASDLPFDNEKNDRRGAYYAPVWCCKFCDWTSSGKGFAIPVHRCEAIAKIEGIRVGCDICQGRIPDLRYDPIYSEREDAWIHFRIPDRGSENIPCKASPIMTELMRKEERIDPKWKAQLDASEKLLEGRREERQKGPQEEA